MARILQLMFQMMKVISFVKDYYIVVIGLVCKSIQGDCFPFHIGMFWIQGEHIRASNL